MSETGADLPTQDLPTLGGRAPAVSVALAFAAGIVADHYAGLVATAWLATAGGAWTGWLLAWRRGSLQCSAGLLLATLFACGGLWHHVRTAVAATDDIATYLDHSRPGASIPVHIRGVLQSAPRLAPRPEISASTAIPEYDRTLCTLACQTLLTSHGPVAVSGHVRLEVAGHVPHADVMDEVEVFGTLAAPVGERNPGGFDFQAYLRQLGLRGVLRVEHPDCVLVVGRSRDWTGARFRSACQARCVDLLNAQLSTRTAPVAIALLLGPREGIPQDVKDAFKECALTHALAISGMHVVILGAFLWILLRLSGFSGRGASGASLAGLVIYALIIDAQPPVVRAMVFSVAAVAGTFLARASLHWNLLAVAVLVVSLWNPSDLLQIGPQLSFLSILGLKAGNQAGQWLRQRRDPLDDEEEGRDVWWRRLLGKLSDGYRLTAGVWLCTLPLVLARFHLISLLGFGINVLLMPWFTVVMWLGYSLLIIGLLFPPAAAIPAVPLDWLLSGLLTVIQYAADVPWSHSLVPGPTDWWLAGFYGMLLPVLGLTANRRWRGWMWRGLGVWCVAGLALAAWPREHKVLRCTFLSVGHGVAILIELPGGQTLLYDTGSLEDADRAAETVEGALWALGRSRIDAALVSHADVDHFNGMPRLLKSGFVDRLFVSPTFFHIPQESTEALCSAAAKARVPIRGLWTEDALRLDSSATVRVLAPDPLTGFGTDNGNSLIVGVEFAGRRLLLTGDLEGTGLVNLLQRPAWPCDVLLAPHHGSRKANSPDLARWARPRCVVISGGREESIAALQPIYGEGAALLSTPRDGAVVCEISPAGEITVKSHLSKQDWRL